MGEIVPVFNSYFFKFSEGTEPEHIECPEIIPTPNYVGLFSVFTAPNAEKLISVAVDIPDEDMARLLADACIARQEEQEKLYGYTDDVHIGFPDGDTQRVYMGSGSW